VHLQHLQLACVSLYHFRFQLGRNRVFLRPGNVHSDFVFGSLQPVAFFILTSPHMHRARCCRTAHAPRTLLVLAIMFRRIDLLLPRMFRQLASLRSFPRPGSVRSYFVLDKLKPVAIFIFYRTAYAPRTMLALAIMF